MRTSSSAPRSSGCRRAFVALLPAVMLIALVASPAAAATNLFIDVKTDYLAGEDFISIQVMACEVAGAMRCFEAPPRSALTTERAAFLAGVRVAELEVPPGRSYLLTATLVDFAGTSIARRQILLELRSRAHISTFVFARPLISADKKAELAEDRDGDGALSHGDVLRYEVVVRNAGRFTDTPGPGGRLIVGSVTTTHGTVTEGNDPGDTSVEVRDLEGAGSAGALITFDVDVEAVVSNQGTAFIDRNPANASWSLAIEPTNDPDTEEPRDPTVRAVACSLGSCEKALEACQSDLGACQKEREEVNDQLTALLGDSDGDSVIAVLDLCPTTAAGAAVDARGCSLVEFCRRVVLSLPSGDVICRRADWLGDEPAECEPLDCKPSAGLCVPE